MSGCNGSDAHQSDGDNEKTISSSIDNSYELHKLSSIGSYHINVMDNVKLSDDAKLKIEKIDNLSTNKECNIASIDKTGFTIETKKPLVCDYLYTISILNGNNTHLVGDKSGYSRVLVSSNPNTAQLIPFGVMVSQNNSITIDVKNELAKVGDHHAIDGFALDSNVVVLPSDGGSAITAGNTVKYTPPVGFEGNVTLSYSLSNSSGDILAGSIIVTISEDAKIGIDIDDSIVIPELIEVGTDTEIDITKYVHDIDPKTPNDFQLIYVNTFNASAKLTDASNAQNKSFIFNASKMGDYYVNAVVTDHHGGFDIALIKINVYDSSLTKSWSDIQVDTLLYSAPLTYLETVATGVDISGSKYDSGVGMNVAVFNYEQAKNFCGTRGRLPTESELHNLVVEKPPATSPQNWPVEAGYWTDNKAIVVNLKDGSSSTPVKPLQYYVTCVSDGEFEIELSKSRLNNIVANGTDTGTIYTTLKLNGKPVQGEEIRASIVPGGTARNPANIVNDRLNTNVDGVAEFKITSLYRGINKIEISYSSLVRTVDVTFKGDATTAVLSLEHVQDGSASTPAKVKGILIDANNNEVEGEDISFEASSSNKSDVSITKDNKLTIADGSQTASIKWISSSTPSAPETVQIHASYGGQDEFKDVNFAFVSNTLSEFTIDPEAALKGGIAFGHVKVLKTDGSPAKNANVSLSTPRSDFSINSNGQSTVVTTDSSGMADVELEYVGTDTKTITTDITAEYNSKKITHNVKFEASAVASKFDVVKMYIKTDQTDPKYPISRLYNMEFLAKAGSLITKPIPVTLPVRKSNDEGPIAPEDAFYTVGFLENGKIVPPTDVLSNDIETGFGQNPNWIFDRFWVHIGYNINNSFFYCKKESSSWIMTSNTLKLSTGEEQVLVVDMLCTP
ncbi:hypothetical protein [Photobacterium damselae]|uniref:hypothetical protein n=1 Tax=Photobacterium damselae TaxID=38293 RepID=UPI004069005D